MHSSRLTSDRSPGTPIHSEGRPSRSLCATDLYKVPDAVPPIHAVSSHIITDKGPFKFRSVFSDNLQPVATRGKKARGTLLVNIVCSFQ